MNAAIAQHLNVVEAAIVRIEEWANVLFVVVRGIGARFVSKKVVKVEAEIKTTLDVSLVIAMGNRWQKGEHDRVYFQSSDIAKWLGLSNSKTRQIASDKFYYNLVDGKFYSNTSTNGVRGEWSKYITNKCTVAVTASQPAKAERRCYNCNTWTNDVSQFSYFLAGSLGTLCADCYDNVENEI